MIHLPCLQPAAYADDWLARKVSTHHRGMLCPSPEGTRRVRTRSRETRLAARSIVTCRTGIPREARSPQKVPERSRSWIGSLCHPVQSLLSDRVSLVPGVAAAPAAVCPSLLSLAPADVAVQPTCLATIARRAPEQECWGGGASPSRALPPPSNVMVRDLDLRAPQ